MKKADLSVMHVVSGMSHLMSPLMFLPGLYHKLHGVPRPVAMKKTVIKRRKRVPAVGVGNNSSRSGSQQPPGSVEPASPAHQPINMPHTPATATAALQPPTATAYDRRPSPRDSRPTPVTATAEAALGQTSSQQGSQTNMVIPSVLLSATGSPRDMNPWWERVRRKREEQEREALKEPQEREGMSVSNLPCCPFIAAPVAVFPLCLSCLSSCWSLCCYKGS
jgi:GATA-binding protein